MIYVISIITAVICFTATFIGGNIIFELDKAAIVENAQIIEPRQKLVTVDLINSQGKRVSNEVFTKQWSLLSFGSTSCQSPCNRNLYQFNRELPLMDSTSRKIHFAFITTDPRTDTWKKMQTYLNKINPAITGYTGSPQQIRKLAKSLGIDDLRKLNQSQLSSYYLINPLGYLTAVYTPVEETGKLAVDLSKLIGNKTSL